MTKLQIVRDLLRLAGAPGDSSLIIDGGCHMGRFALEAAEMFPHPRVLAFEPDPESFASAERDAASRPEITISTVRSVRLKDAQNYFADR